MARVNKKAGEYTTTLKEARKKGNMDQFLEEHRNDPPGDTKKFYAILRHAAGKSKEALSSSGEAASDGCSETQTPQRTSGGASGRRGRGSRGSSS
jgi:hypothetical protein